MTTLNEAIQTTITNLEATVASIQSKAVADVAAVQVEIDQAKQHLTGLAPYLEHELTAAKDEVVAFFAKLGL